MRIGKRLLILTLGLSASAYGTAEAQTRLRGAIGPIVATNSVNSDEAGVTTELSGFSAGIQAHGSAGPVFLEARYNEGSIESDDGLAARDLVEGEVILGLNPVRWIRIGLGPHARSFITEGGTQRWLFWEGRFGVQPQLVVPALRGFAEIWRALSSDVDQAGEFDLEQGMQAGILFQPERTPVWISLSYRVDQARLDGESRLETAQQLALSVGFGRW